MPSKVKNKLLIITILCATLAVLFVIAPLTAALYSVIFLGLSLFLSILAWSNARNYRELQYKISSFMGLMVMIFIAMTAAIANIVAGGMQYIMVAACGIVAVRCITLAFAADSDLYQ